MSVGKYIKSRKVITVHVENDESRGAYAQNYVYCLPFALQKRGVAVSEKKDAGRHEKKQRVIIKLP